MVSLLQAENTTQLLQQLTRILPVIVMTDHKILKRKISKSRSQLCNCSIVYFIIVPGTSLNRLQTQIGAKRQMGGIRLQKLNLYRIADCTAHICQYVINTGSC
jgi:hypothetical protein